MRGKRYLTKLLFMAACIAMLCGVTVHADHPVDSLPTELNVKLTSYKSAFDLGDEISGEMFKAQWEDGGDGGGFKLDGVIISETEFPIYGTLAHSDGYTWEQSEKITLKKNKYYSLGVVIKSPYGYCDYKEKYEAKNPKANLTWKDRRQAELGLWYRTITGDKDFVMRAWITLTPEDIHPTHQWGEWEKQSDGTMVRTCTNAACGETEKHEHTWGDWTVIAPATAISEEVQTRQCSSDVCQHESEERTIHSIHVYDTYKVVTQPTVTSDGNKIATCKICNMTSSFPIPHLVSDHVKLSASSFPLKKGKSYTVKVSNLVEGDTVTWSSQTPKIAAVDSKGRITALKTGTAIIRMKLASGKEALVTVKVQKDAVKTKKITGLPKKLTLKKGKKQTLMPVIAPVTSNEKVTYTTSDKKIAAVNKKGVIKAGKKGKAVITVQSGKVIKKIKVTVK